MLDIFRGLKSLIKISHVHIDTAVFRLHYSMTVILLIAFSLIVTTRQYVGNPIDCIHKNAKAWRYLFLVWTIRSRIRRPKERSTGDSFLHASMAVERLGRWQDPCADDGPRHRSVFRGREETEEEDAARLSVGESSLSQLVGLQVLPLRSSRPGECGRFLESDQEDRVDPMIYVFPRMTKCTFYKYGVSGEVERHDAVCILPLNVVNEKIYVFLWFWFLFLGILSFITVLYRIVIIFSPRTRVYLLRLRFRLVRREAVETIVRRSKVGDWFLLYMLGENLDTVIYRDVMHELANKLASRHHHSVPGIKGELQEA
ncbi:innexin family member shaking B isoform X3 [Ptiloglossa arizonensis]|uniref:innexin family member shaking B isoform X3 n=1 Tax=Ptiloglossa arizonensis TaxID=3350558 RepID=UPI003F9F4815